MKVADDAAWSALLPVDLDQVGAARGGRGALELAGGDDGAVIGQEVRAVVDEVLGAAQMAGIAGRIGDEHGVHAPDEVQGLDGHGVGGQGVDVLGRTAAGDLTGRRTAEAVGDDGLGVGLFGQQAGGVRQEFRDALVGGRFFQLAVIHQQLFGLVGDLAHVLHGLHREVAHGGLFGEHHTVGAVQHGVGHVRGLGAGGGLRDEPPQ